MYQGLVARTILRPERNSPVSSLISPCACCKDDLFQAWGLISVSDFRFLEHGPQLTNKLSFSNPIIGSVAMQYCHTKSHGSLQQYWRSQCCSGIYSCLLSDDICIWNWALVSISIEYVYELSMILAYKDPLGLFKNNRKLSPVLCSACRSYCQVRLM